MRQSGCLLLLLVFLGCNSARVTLNKGPQEDDNKSYVRAIRCNGTHYLLYEYNYFHADFLNLDNTSITQFEFQFTAVANSTPVHLRISYPDINHNIYDSDRNVSSNTCSISSAGLDFNAFVYRKTNALTIRISDANGNVMLQETW